MGGQKYEPQKVRHIHTLCREAKEQGMPQVCLEDAGEKSYFPFWNNCG